VKPSFPNDHKTIKNKDNTMNQDATKSKTSIMTRADEGAGYQQTGAAEAERLAWWREARFGMFVHWGLYSILGGAWKGEEAFPHPEWIMRHKQIPVREYETLARDFLPDEANVVEWVRLGEDAGMKYLVVTAKHHDGFALFDSPSSPFNVVACTPWKRDPMKILARECQSLGIRLCFYYSQSQDWHDPNGLGNDWDFPKDEQKDFAYYLEHKVKPQLRELLTQYGDIGLIWFDTPLDITHEQSLDLKKWVRSFQPGCLACGRIGNGIGDYGVLGDHQLPAGETLGDWEVPATLNKNWGFRTSDQAWKTPGQVLQTLATVLGKGCNYLLNVGPDGRGKIPAAAQDILSEVGKWVKTNGEAVHGTQAGPFLDPLPWGTTAMKENRLFLYVSQVPQDGMLELSGTTKPPQRVCLLNGKDLPFTCKTLKTLATNDVIITLEKSAAEKGMVVVALDFDETPEVAGSLVQSPRGVVLLPAFRAQLNKVSKDSALCIDQGGVCDGWTSTDDSVTWHFFVRKSGTYTVELFTCATKYPRKWGGGHRVEARCAGITLPAEIRADSPSDTARALHLPEFSTRVGTLALPVGWQQLEVRATDICISGNTPNGLTISELRLLPSA
jgi:alpha-L-fucosidase